MFRAREHARRQLRDGLRLVAGGGVVGYKFKFHAANLEARSGGVNGAAAGKGAFARGALQ